MDWLRQQPATSYRRGDFLLVHAGLLLQLTVEQAGELAGEAHTAMRGDQCLFHLARSVPSGALQWHWTPDSPARLAIIIKIIDQTESLPQAKASWNLSFGATGPDPGRVSTLVRHIR